MTKIQARIETLKEKKLIGQKLFMTLSNNKTGELWRNFVPHRKEILNNLNTDLISLQMYPESFDFDPNKEFEKWAAVEVSDFENIPDNMNTLLLKGGLYAVFDYKGSSADTGIFQYIFTKWLPNSEFLLDNRPHFEILGEKYKNNDPESEEEIWIPIKKK